MNDITLERTLPASLEIERLLLGHILLSGKADIDLEDTEFYLESHRLMWRAIQDMTNLGQAPDIISVKNYLQGKDQLESAGGASYLASLTDGVPQMPQGISPQYAAILREKSALRLGIQASNDMMIRCYMAEEPFKDIVESSFSRVDGALARIDRMEGPRPISDLISDTYKILELIGDRKSPGGFLLGYTELDRIIPTGINRKNMCIIAGRPGHGKTSLLIGICLKMAKTGIPIVFFSLEMAAMELIVRMLAAIGHVSITKMNTGFLNREDWSRIGRAAGEISQLPIWIDDSSALTVADMRSRTRRLNKSIGAMLIDYLQLVNVAKHMQSRNDVEKISSISMGLKGMAKSMDIAVVAAAQLSRSPEKRRDAEPKLSDLRQSGQIEQDADQVLLLYREELSSAREENQGIANVIVAKQRNGPTGSLQMAFMKEFSMFENLWTEGNEETWWQK